MLVRRGLTQRHEATFNGRRVKVWPVARTHADALRLLRWLRKVKRQSLSQISVAKIGSVEGETLEGHIELAIKEGCEGICCVLGWNKDGSPKWGWLSAQD